MTNRFEAEKTEPPRRGRKTSRERSRRDDRSPPLPSLLFERAAGEDSSNTSPPRSRRSPATPSPSSAIAPEPTAVRVADIADADRAGRVAHGDRAFHRQPPLHLRFGARRAAGARPRRFGWSCIRSSMSAATRPARRWSFRDARSASRARAGSARASCTCTCRSSATRRTGAALAESADGASRRGAARHRRLGRDARAAARARSPTSASTIRRFRGRSLEETIAFLQWLDEGNFVFLGMREYSYAGTLDEPVERSGGGERPRPAPRSDGDGASPRHRGGDADARDPRVPHGARSARS